MQCSKNLWEGNILLGKSADFDYNVKLLNTKNSDLPYWSRLHYISVYIDMLTDKTAKHGRISYSS